MKIIMGIFVFVVFVYTAGFAVVLWKNKNKLGSLAVLVLAISLLIAPFFSEIG